MSVARGCAFGLLISMFLWVVIFTIGALVWEVLS